MNGFAIRRAGADDAELLAAIGAKTFRDTFEADNTAEDMAAYLSAAFGKEKQAAELADGAISYFVAESAGAAIGYLEVKEGEAPGCVTGASPVELARLYVVRPWFGRGVANALMEQAIAEGRARGHATLWLGVWERNLRAQAFYQRWGFRRVGEHVFVLGRDPQTDWLMERAI